MCNLAPLVEGFFPLVERIFKLSVLQHWSIVGETGNKHLDIVLDHHCSFSLWRLPFFQLLS